MTIHRPRTAHAAFLGLLTVVPAALARPDGFEWATIGNPNNAAYPGDPDTGGNAGRGSVGYIYNIAKTEVTTGQFMEFLNTFAKRGINLSGLEPNWWGGQGSWTSGYTLRNVPNAAMIPVQGINWRNAAKYVNWLTNGKSADFVSLNNGSYDASTFHTNPDGTFTDQLAHTPAPSTGSPRLTSG